MRAAVVPCSGAKLTHRAPAGELYTGQLYRSAVMAAEALLERGEVDLVLVLSAKHGLVRLDRHLDPYDTRVGDAGAVFFGDVARQLDELEVTGLVRLLPAAYDALLVAAATLSNLNRGAGWLAGWPIAGPGELELVDVGPNPLAGAAGIGDQRGRLRKLREGEPLRPARGVTRRELVDELAHA